MWEQWKALVPDLEGPVQMQVKRLQPESVRTELQCRQDSVEYLSCLHWKKDGILQLD
jgi:hypothetical protein